MPRAGSAARGLCGSAAAAGIVPRRGTGAGCRASCRSGAVTVAGVGRRAPHRYGGGRRASCPAG